MRIVILISGTGSTMAAVLRAAAEADYPVEVAAVGADRHAPGLGRAREAGVPVFTVDFAAYGRRALWDAALAERLAEFAPGLVVCAGFMRILGPEVLSRHTAINIHPALLPAFPGAHAVRDALDYGVRCTGSTVHFVDEGVDTGPVLEQAPVRVQPGDDEGRLHARIKAAEQRMLVTVVGRLAREGWQVEGRQVHYGGRRTGQPAVPQEYPPNRP